MDPTFLGLLSTSFRPRQIECSARTRRATFKAHAPRLRWLLAPPFYFLPSRRLRLHPNPNETMSAASLAPQAPFWCAASPARVPGAAASAIVDAPKLGSFAPRCLVGYRESSRFSSIAAPRRLRRRSQSSRGGKLIVSASSNARKTHFLFENLLCFGHSVCACRPPDFDVFRVYVCGMARIENLHSFVNLVIFT